MEERPVLRQRPISPKNFGEILATTSRGLRTSADVAIPCCNTIGDVQQSPAEGKIAEVSAQRVSSPTIIVTPMEYGSAQDGGKKLGLAAVSGVTLLQQEAAVEDRSGAGGTGSGTLGTGSASEVEGGKKGVAEHDTELVERAPIEAGALSAAAMAAGVTAASPVTTLSNFGEGDAAMVWGGGAGVGVTVDAGASTLVEGEMRRSVGDVTRGDGNALMSMPVMFPAAEGQSAETKGISSDHGDDGKNRDRGNDQNALPIAAAPASACAIAVAIATSTTTGAAASRDGNSVEEQEWDEKEDEGNAHQQRQQQLARPAATQTTTNIIATVNTKQKVQVEGVTTTTTATTPTNTVRPLDEGYTRPNATTTTSNLQNDNDIDGLPVGTSSSSNNDSNIEENFATRATPLTAPPQHNNDNDDTSQRPRAATAPESTENASSSSSRYRRGPLKQATIADPVKPGLGPPLRAEMPPRRDIRRRYLTNLGMKRAVAAGPGGTRKAPPMPRRSSFQDGVREQTDQYVGCSVCVFFVLVLSFCCLVYCTCCYQLLEPVLLVCFRFIYYMRLAWLLLVDPITP